MKQKKIIAILLAILLCSANPIYAAASTSSLYYSSEINRMKSLNILDVTYDYDSMLTRGDFTRALVIASGQEDLARSSQGPTIFPDVAPNDPLSGYINVAVNKGLMKGAMDKKYHPEAYVSFAQMCTTLVKALGYSDSDIKGTWPKNYVLKAKELGLTSGIDLKDNDTVPGWVGAVMMSRLLDTNIKKNSAADADKTFAAASGILSDSYQLAQITNPVYSRPELAENISATTTQIGSINLSGSTIVKNGRIIDISEIEDGDVVYQVSDVWNTKRYILVTDNKVQGQITGISSSGIEVDGRKYEFGSGMDLNRFITSQDEFEVGDYITLIMGYDGKIVDFFDVEHQDNGDYAFVVNYTSDASGYTVKLLMIDGNIRTFKTNYYPGSYKGQLVRYEITYKDVVSLTGISNNYPGQVEIDKQKRLIDDTYVSHDVKIFNVVSNNVGQYEDVKVNLIKWSDMPQGTLESGKILYMNEFGNFNDTNIIVTNDLFNDMIRTGIVKTVTPMISNVQKMANGQMITVQEVTGHNYTIVVDGLEKPWKDSYAESAASAGNVVKVSLTSSGSIDTISEIRYAEASTYKADAVNVSRIKISGTSYDIAQNVQVYFAYPSGNYTLGTINDIEAGRTYSNVSIYLDRSLYNGGRVDTIIIRY